MSYSQKGQSLIEIVFAIAIFTIGIVTIGYLLIESRVSLHYATNLTKARLLATEGIEVVSSIRDGDFDLIPAGVYGLVLEDGLWLLSSSSDKQGKFLRTITINDVDKDNKQVISTVEWNIIGDKNKSVSYTTRLTDWQQTGGEAGFLDIYTESVINNASNTAMYGLSFRSNSDQNMTITAIKFDWSGSSTLNYMTIDGVEMFNASTSGAIDAGTEIDISDYLIGADTGIHSIDVVAFDGSIENSNFIISFSLQDGSVKSAHIP